MLEIAFAVALGLLGAQGASYLLTRFGCRGVLRGSLGAIWTCPGLVDS